jgi:hypothetical protein
MPHGAQLEHNFKKTGTAQRRRRAASDTGPVVQRRYIKGNTFYRENIFYTGGGRRAKLVRYLENIF